VRARRAATDARPASGRILSRAAAWRLGMRDTADISHAALYITARPAASGLLAFGKILEAVMTERSSEGLDVRRRRLLFRAWRRGVRETDLIVGRFADAYIERLDAPALDDFERLIEVPNGDLYAWVVGDDAVPPEFDTAVLRDLIAFNARTKEER
jgi:antitoxin CptB